MSKKRGKPVNFDAVVRFFIHRYEIPTKDDLNKLITRLDRLEQLLMKSAGVDFRKNFRSYQGKSGGSASDHVLNVIKSSENGISFKELLDKTQYEVKKLRNIIFRLGKLKTISQVKRGVYKANSEIAV